MNIGGQKSILPPLALHWEGAAAPLPPKVRPWGGDKNLKIPTYLVLKGQNFFDHSKNPFSGRFTWGTYVIFKGIIDLNDHIFPTTYNFIESCNVKRAFYVIYDHAFTGSCYTNRELDLDSDW